MLAVALTGFTTVTQAAAQKDNTWYTGGKLGWSYQQHDDVRFYSNSDNSRISNSSTNKDQLGASAFVGYQANQYFGFVLGYDWLGYIAYKSSVTNSFFKAQGISLSTKLSYPLTNNLDIYTNIGGIVCHTDLKSASNSKHTGHRSDKYTGISPLVSIGLEYSWTKNWVTSLDYQWISNINITDSIRTHPDSNLLSIGLSYRFGQNTIQAVTPTPMTPVTQTNQFTLQSDILFDFDKVTIKPQGQQALDQLSSQINSMNQQDYSIIVLGFTDRLGSDWYNQKLSQERIQSVVRYLVSKGIPLEKITTHSMGKSNPVTGKACNYAKDRPTMIDCLAPDRHVKIEVKGIKGIITQQ